jgi:FkbM family methyltransferase
MLKQTIRRVANSLGYSISKSSELPEIIHCPFIDLLEIIIRDLLQRQQTLFFMQIGAHDGSFADPISHLVKRYHWSGILVEPQPRAFEQLKQNYQGEDQLIFEQAIVAQKPGTVKFYQVRTPEGVELPEWLGQSAGLDRQMLVGALYYWKFVEKCPGIPDDYESLIEEVQMPAVTVASLLARHQIPQLDVLVIDTMGHDFEIIKSIPFETIKPAIIHFEHSLLSFRDRQDCLAHLKAQGYRFAKVAVDTIAYLDAPVRYWDTNGW